PWRAEEYIREKLKRKERIMGFGHRVYKNVMDPRTIELKALAKMLAEQKDSKWFEIAEAVERAMYKYKKLLPNVDFYSACIYATLGIPDDLFIPIFAIGRIAGWVAHIIEQYENNRLIRPRAQYVGPKNRKYIPIDQRSK
ncbi:MAG TPA: citrate synthase, partial [Archaeoglobus profundus]|nr:citrate synthase [Archaeoglobus profundus]